MNFKLSRSATYLRLLPRRGDSRKGKRHIQTVKVKLLRPENLLRKKNIGRMFAKSFIDDLRDVCEIFGPGVVLACNVKGRQGTRRSLGLAADSLQSPLVMHLGYKVRLPGHTFVVGERHILIPSVYVICDFDKKGKLTYSGEPFIRVRSGKHESSTASTHAHDIRELFMCERLYPKPIMIIMSGGG